MQAQYDTKLIYREQDADGDWVWGNSENDMLSGLQAMRQVVYTRLRAIRGEWWEGDGTALPYFDGMIGSPGSTAQIRKIDLWVIARLMDTVNVVNVRNFSSSFENRSYRCSCTVETVYGNVEAEVSL